MEQVETNEVEVQEVEASNVENNKKAYVEKSTMPITRNYLILKALRKMNIKKFNSKHRKQNTNKVKALKKRQRKLKSIGLNLSYF